MQPAAGVCMYYNVIQVIRHWAHAALTAGQSVGLRLTDDLLVTRQLSTLSAVGAGSAPPPVIPLTCSAAFHYELGEGALPRPWSAER